MIRHKFVIVIDGVQFINSVNFKSLSDLFQNIEMINTDGFDFELTITKRRTSNMETSINEAKIEADLFADKLALIENHNIISLKYLGYLDEENILRHEKKGVVVSAGMTALIKDQAKYYSDLAEKNIFNSNTNLGLKKSI